MIYLFEKLTEIRKKLKNRPIMLFLDYDGTIVPIAKTPLAAILPARAWKALKNLSTIGSIKLAIISGRSLKDIKKMVRIKGIVYSGNHGMETAGPGIIHKAPLHKNMKMLLKKTKNELANELSGISGVIIEDKGFSLSIHYRLSNPGNENKILNIVNKNIRPYVHAGTMNLSTGKKVIEIRPATIWNKGTIVRWLLARQKSLTGKNKILSIYIGDDETDEDAFDSLNTEDLTVFVGEPDVKSSARYILKNTEEVIKLMEWLYQAREIESQ